MKLRLPNKLIAAIVAAATPALFSTLSTATLGAAAVATLSQQAMATVTTSTATSVTVTGGETYTSTEEAPITINVYKDNQAQGGTTMTSLAAADYTVFSNAASGNGSRYQIKAATTGLADAGTLIIGSVTYTPTGETTSTTATSGQLWLGDRVDISNNLVLGSSGYKEGGYNGVIRMENGGTFSGEVSIVDDTKLTFRSSGTAAFTNIVSGAGHTLTVEDKDHGSTTLNLQFSGGATLGKLASNNTQVLLSGRDKTYTFGSLTNTNSSTPGASTENNAAAVTIDGATLVLNNGESTANSMRLVNTVGTSGGAKVELTNGASLTLTNVLQLGKTGQKGTMLITDGSLKVKSINAWYQANLEAQRGSLEFTNSTAYSGSYGSGNPGKTYLGISSTGTLSAAGAMVLKATASDWRFAMSNNGVLQVGNVTIDADNTHRITLVGAQLKGTIVNNKLLTLESASATGNNARFDGTGTTVLVGGTFRNDNAAITKSGSGTLEIAGDLTAADSGITMYNGNLNFTSGNTTLKRIVTTNSGNGTGSVGNTAINIGTAESNATVKVERIELADTNTSYSSTLSINSGSKLIVTGNNNGADYKTASLLLGEWNQKTTAHVAGELLAKDALLLGGDYGFDMNINGGTVAVVGVGQSHSYCDPQESLQITNNGKLILGAKGIDSTGTGGNASTGLSVSIADGTIGLSAANVTINRPVSITGNATFDTDLYAFNDDGTAIAKPEGEQTSGTFNISGGLSIGDAGMVTVAGGGSVNLSGSVNVHNTVDTSIALFSEGTYGYLSSINVKFVDDASIDKVVANDVSWSVGGMTTAQLGFTGATYADGAVSMTSLAQDAPKRWFMNTGEGGTFTYTGAAEQEMTSIIINAKQDAEGNTPVLHLNTTGAPTTLTNITVNNTTANIDLASGAVLNGSSLMTNQGGQAVLTGAGTFNLGAMSMGGSSAVNLTLPTGVSVGAADAWTGVVSVGGTIQWLNAASLSSLANANSWVEFKGVSGYFNSSQTVAANIRFTDNGGEAAFKTTGVFSNSTLTYNGKISGSGTYYLNGASGGMQTFKFNGDASAWTGTLKSNNTNAGNQIDIANKFGATLLNEGGTMTVNFNSGAISAGAVQNSGTTLTANFNSGSEFTGALQSNAGTLKAYNNTGDTLSLRTIGLQGGNVELYSGRFSIDKNDNTYGLFTDAAGNAGTLTINNGASLSLAAQHKFYQFQLGKAGTGVIVKNGGSFELNSFGGTQYTVTALSSAADASVKRKENSTGQINYTIEKTDVRIENAKLDISAIQQNTAFANELKNTAVVNNATGALTVSNSANTLVGVDAEGGAILVQNAANSAATLKSIKAVGGDVTIQSLGAGATVNLNELYVAGSKTVSAYTGTPTAEQIAAAQNGSNTAVEATLAISNGKLTAGNGAHLNAHLSLGNNTTLDIADATVGGAGLTMGSTVTFEQGGKMKLSDDIINGLNGLITSQAFHSGLTLFSGVDSFNINGAAYDEGATYAASDYFNLTGVTRPWDFVVKFGDADAMRQSGSGQSIYLWMETPEPATATLSLLALAALAARRKRK